METITRQVRASKDVFKELRILAAMNEISIGKMLEVLIKWYKKTKGE